MDTTMNITHTGLRPRSEHARSVHPLHPMMLPRALFVAELLALRLTHVARDSFRGTATPSRLPELGAPVLVRSDAADDEVEAIIRLRSGEPAWIDTGHGHVRVEVAGRSGDAAKAAVRGLRRALESAPPAPERISIAFWMRGDCGGEVRHRQIEADSFDAIADNYSALVRDALERLIVTRSPGRGRLILWRGEPGTGKSNALRALARAWAPWCTAHFIMDPEELLGRGGAYMLDLLASDDEDEDGWRLLILEDAGELIAADARAVTGQALSRLLNVADGVIGQGTRTLLLITTNEPVKRLHPATRRPGRCLADIEFTALSVPEANAWLAARGHEHRVDRPTPLAELFAGASEGPLTLERAAAPAFGFARAFTEQVEHATA
ncbi:MAG TPA: DUF5925 domain-containing protein [Solirubrobacteraceae bacterium]|nr:DUF5925 domain-containing protein [Solirubrobacteraceae bacterium]